MSGSLLGLAIPDVAADPSFVEWLVAAIDGDVRGGADGAGAASGGNLGAAGAAGNLGAAGGVSNLGAAGAAGDVDAAGGGDAGAPDRIAAAHRAADSSVEAPIPRIRRPDPRPEGSRDVAHLAAALLAVEPVAVRRHRRLGLAGEVTAATLADIGRKIDAYGASVDLSWLVGLARADVVALGRLQFERWASSEGRALHIPEGGPLDPPAVDDSLRQARELFGDGPIVCHTWLFDPALQALPPGSNIVAFARRFEIAAPGLDAGENHEADPWAADHAVAKFVFRRPLEEVLDPALIRPRTTVERIVAGHLRSGAHWSEPHGILVSAPG